MNWKARVGGIPFLRLSKRGSSPNERIRELSLFCADLLVMLTNTEENSNEFLVNQLLRWRREYLFVITVFLNQCWNQKKISNNTNRNVQQFFKSLSRDGDRLSNSNILTTDNRNINIITNSIQNLKLGVDTFTGYNFQRFSVSITKNYHRSKFRFPEINYL